MLKTAIDRTLFLFLVTCLLLSCDSSREKQYLKILQNEKTTVQHYISKGYVAYLQDTQKQLPQKIAEKNRCVEAINASYLQMERQQKNEYIEIWRPRFTEAWQAYEKAFVELKSSFQPQNDLEKSTAQTLEMQWQALMQENNVVSLEAPLFFVTGD